MAEITIQEYVFENWQFDSATIELRIFANQYFVSLSGVVFQPPAVDQSNGIWYQAVTCTPDLTAKTLTIPEFTLESTTDGQPNNATFQFVFYSGPQPSGIPIVSFFGLSNAVVGTSPLTTSIPALININGQPAQSNLFSYYYVFFSIFSQFYAGVAFPDGDTTPSVFNHNTFFTANTAPTNIVDFTESYNQQVIEVFIGDDNTSIFGDPRNNGAFLLFGRGVDNAWHEMTSGALGIQTINGNSNLNQVIETNGAVDGSPVVSSTAGTTTLTNPVAGPSQAGIVTDTAQEIGGQKTFHGPVIMDSPSVVGALTVGPNGTTNPAFRVISGASVVNGVSIAGQPTSADPLIAAIGSDADVGLELQSKGDGAVQITTGPSLNKRFVFDVAGLSTPEPINFQGSSSGEVKVEAQAVAGNKTIKWPNTSGTIGQNVGIADITGDVITWGYQANGGLTDADPAGIPGMLIGVSTPSQIVLIYVGNTTFLLPLTGSTAVAKVAATAQTDFDIQVNGVSKGTIRFAASGTVASIISPVSSVIGANDVVQIVGPLVPDATLANVGFNLKGTSNVAASTPVSIATNVLGLTTPTQEILIFPANSSFTMPGTGSVAVAKIAATAQTDFLVKVNGTTKLTLRFAASGTVASVVGAVSASIVSGNLIEIIGPATPDLTLANIGFNLLGST